MTAADVSASPWSWAGANNDPFWRKARIRREREHDPRGMLCNRLSAACREISDPDTARQYAAHVAREYMRTTRTDIRYDPGLVERWVQATFWHGWTHAERRLSTERCWRADLIAALPYLTPAETLEREVSACMKRWDGRNPPPDSEQP